MRSQKGFRHKGLVSRVFDGAVEVEVSAIAACEGCKAKASCMNAKAGGDGGGGGADKRVLRVACDDAARYFVGDVVDVSVSYGVGFLAVFMCYVLPLVVLLFALVFFVALGLDEGLAAVATLCAVGLYYFILYRCRDRFEQRVTFGLRKI